MKVFDYPSSTLSKKLADEYGYDEFIVRRWLHFFGEDETIDLIEAMENIPKYIRINTIKIDEKILVERLENRGFVLEKTEVDFCYMVVEESYSIGATPEYLMGYYYVMDKSSCIPPLVLSPQKDEIVSDFAASPGGKTTFLAQLMDNRGIILAIEVQKERIPPLIDNIHRMGVMNTAVIQMDSRKFSETGLKIDKILLDAPCTGEGIIHKDPSRKVSRGKEDILFCSSMQTSLLKSAVDSLRDCGVVVYSTCSMTPEENEFVVSNVLDFYEKRGIRLEIEKVPWGVKSLKLEGVRDELKNARRLYPHKHGCSGFFVAKIRKTV
jgi:NOL1/NOP2/sun family putative RNA methylase